jgi:hypothetical protein
MNNTHACVDLQGWQVLASTIKDAIYLRIPTTLQRPIEGGCSCSFCKAHPTATPMWDTLGIPLNENGYRSRTWTLHAPEWKTR